MGSQKAEKRRTRAPERPLARHPAMSVLSPCGEMESSDGYSGSPDGSFIYGAQARKLRCEDYQDLIDRGWRRSGTFMYRPLNEKTRSPQYTIRLDALRFQPSAKQEALLQRIDRYVRGEKSREEVREGHKAAKKRRRSLTRDRRRDALAELLAAHRDALWAALEQAIPECAQLDATALRFRVVDSRRASFDASLDAAAPVAGRLRGVAKRSGADVAACPSVDTVATALASAIRACEGLQGAVSRLEPVKGGHLGLCFAPTFAAAAPHGGAKPGSGAAEATSGAAPPEPARERSGHDYTITLEPAEFTEERWQLFRKYQIAVHGEDEAEVTERGFRRFLVNSPLIPEAFGGGGEGEAGGANEASRKREASALLPAVDGAANLRRHGYGSFHMLHRVDGTLVAVGVVDVLPRCLSSVYLFYDPAWKALAPGKLSALKEAQWVRSAAAASPQLKWYYLGYYVHSCHKMRYKAQYSPSEMLCHETWRWFPAEECIAKLEEGPQYRRFAPAEVQSSGGDAAAATFSIQLGGKPLRVEHLTEESQDRVREIFRELGRHTGPDVAPRLELAF